MNCLHFYHYVQQKKTLLSYKGKFMWLYTSQLKRYTLHALTHTYTNTPQDILSNASELLKKKILFVKIISIMMMACRMIA